MTLLKTCLMEVDLREEGFLFFVGAMTAVDVKTNKMVKKIELDAEKLASNHKIKHEIKHRNQ